MLADHLPGTRAGGVATVPLAHHGMLFLDELSEYARGLLDALRQPLEDEAVTIARASGFARFPARSLLVAAMNPWGFVALFPLLRRSQESS
jgi:predicted ATPase with chaperone activity